MGLQLPAAASFWTLLSPLGSATKPPYPQEQPHCKATQYKRLAEDSPAAHHERQQFCLPLQGTFRNETSFPLTFCLQDNGETSSQILSPD